MAEDGYRVRLRNSGTRRHSLLSAASPVLAVSPTVDRRRDTQMPIFFVGVPTPALPDSEKFPHTPTRPTSATTRDGSACEHQCSFRTRPDVEVRRWSANRTGATRLIFRRQYPASRRSQVWLAIH